MMPPRGGADGAPRESPESLNEAVGSRPLSRFPLRRGLDPHATGIARYSSVDSDAEARPRASFRKPNAAGASSVAEALGGVAATPAEPARAWPVLFCASR